MRGMYGKSVPMFGSWDVIVSVSGELGARGTFDASNRMSHCNRASSDIVDILVYAAVTSTGKYMTFASMETLDDHENTSQMTYLSTDTLSLCSLPTTEWSSSSWTFSG